ncbi:MAG: YkgJ family cysteine cluster protein [Verrucomicrobiota bacterium]
MLSSCRITTDHPDLPPCAGCGRCCHLVVELRAGDCVPAALVVEHDGVRCMDQRGDGACVGLDPATLLCTLYADRPQTCREFNRGEPLCRRTLAAPTFPRRAPPAPR